MDRAILHASCVGILMVGLSVCAARADRVHLHDGSALDGLIVEQTPTHLVIATTEAGVVLPRRILRMDVERVVWGAEPVPAERIISTEEELARRRRIAELTGTGQAYFDFGAWCADKKLHTEAAAALEIAAQADPKLAEQALLLAVSSLVAEDHIERAKHVLTELVRANPSNLRAALELGRLEADNASRVARQVSLALERFQRGEYTRSISTLVRLANLKDPAILADAASQVRTHTGMSIPELIAECRFRTTCMTCSKKLRTGLVSCPTCKGRGSLTHARGRDASADPICTTCRGFTYIICPTCGGAGHDFGDIGTVEREAMLARLRAEVDRGWLRDVKPWLDPETELSASAAEGILLACRRLRYFLGYFEAHTDRLGSEPETLMHSRMTTLDALIERVNEVYAGRRLESAITSDRIELDRLLFEDEAILREIVGEPSGATRREPPADEPRTTVSPPKR